MEKERGGGQMVKNKFIPPTEVQHSSPHPILCFGETREETQYSAKK